MIEITYLHETIEILETVIKPDAVLNDEDYLIISLRILKCDSNLMFNENLKRLVHISTDMDKFRELTRLFYSKMRGDLGEEDE